LAITAPNIAQQWRAGKKIVPIRINFADAKDRRFHTLRFLVIAASTGIVCDDSANAPP
jgi:hypothetical protein